MTATRTVVFAYSEVGARCLKTLLAAGWQIALVVTHADSPHETQWFQSVRDVALAAKVPVITDDSLSIDELAARVRALAPQFIFSFYFRRMLSSAMLEAASRGAFNMHGSLLPKYRGRAPINWAILHGETQTGASLHRMTVKPDAGELMDQQAVPIGADDTALEVTERVAAAAIDVLSRSLPKLLDGSLKGRVMDLASGSYYSGRRPEDGEFFPHWPAKRIHDLVRAVAPPFPGAFVRLPTGVLKVFRTERLAISRPNAPVSLSRVQDTVQWTAYDGACLRIVSAEWAQTPLTADNFESLLHTDHVSFDAV
jgi:methionyl-tRNA formyltransferase